MGDLGENLLDSQDMFEIILKHLIRCPIVFKRALEIGMTAEDLSSSEIGIQVYKQLAEIAFTISNSPIDPALFMSYVANRIDNGIMDASQNDDIAALCGYIFTGSLNSDYVKRELSQFVKRRRLTKARINNDDVEKLVSEFSKLAIEFEARVDVKGESLVINPFEKLVKKRSSTGLMTGFSGIDTMTGGIGLGTYNLLMGYSGCGKTAITTNILKFWALAGNPSVFFSAEEPGEDITQRVYSQTFRIPYTSLYKGVADFELEDAFSKMDELMRDVFMRNLRIIDVRDEAPISYLKLQNKLEDLAQLEGFVAKGVILDQLEFIEPVGKCDATWEKENQASKEMDALSHYKIGGTSNFGLIVNHQAKGKVARTFTREQISGFKGIIKPADSAFGVGRVDERSDEFCAFSLKTRHSKGFEVDMLGELEFMTFKEQPKNMVKKTADNGGANPLSVPPWLTKK